MGQGVYLLGSVIHVVLAVALFAIALSWRPCQSRVYLVLVGIFEVIVHTVGLALHVVVRVGAMEVFGLVSIASIVFSVLGSVLLVLFALAMKSELTTLHLE